MKLQKLLTSMRICIQKYDLIREGDCITVGLSGGKDSLVLLYGLRKLMDFYPVPFSLKAVTVDPGFSTDYSPLAEFCEKIGVPYGIERTQIADIVFRERKEEHPCSLCANMRRGALINAATAQNSGVLALGHHKDDYLITLLLSTVYEGRFYTFAPSTEYPDREVRVIRPLLYVPEASIRDFCEENAFPVIRNLCPADHRTKREEMSELLSELRKKYPDIKEKLLHAVESSDIEDWKKLRKE